jgi:putative membrane protein
MSVISWMAALFYLPRLFVYHTEHIDKPQFVEVVKIQEYKLYKYINVPAMWATLISGILMLILNFEFFKTEPWIYAKLFLISVLVVYSYSMETYRKQLLNSTCKKSGKFFRAYNEAPTLLSILIVTFVVLKDIPVYFTIFMVAVFALVVYVLLKHAKEPNLDVLN